MATIDDILTTQKNGVIAINNLSQSLTSFYEVYNSVVGNTTSNTLTTNSQVFKGSGRLVGFTVVTAGSAGALYDSVLSTVISASYTSTTATLVYGAQTPLFAVGDTIIVSGMTPSGYNGSYTVTAIGTDITTGAPNVTYSNSTNAAITVTGICFNGSVRYQRASVPPTAGYAASNIIVTNGLVYAPGASQTANFTYYQ